MIHSLAGLPAFSYYFVVAVALCVVFLIFYIKAAPHEEFELNAHRGNTAAALALGMSLLGFALPLSSAIYHSADIVDCIIWGVVALLVQIIAFFLRAHRTAQSQPPHLNNEIAGALWLGFVSLTAGILSAACMST